MTQDDRVALVTGANKGIGLEIARQLAEAGLTVLLGARDPEKGRMAAEALAASGLRTRFVQLDVTDETSIAAAAERIATEDGRLDILVNNPGIVDGADAAPSAAGPAAVRLIGYNASKAALNMLTLQLAAELEGSSIAVNAVVPGFVQTDLTGGEGTMTTAEGARLPVRYALSTNGISGRFAAPSDGDVEIELPW